MTLLEALNVGLAEIGEPQITSIDADNVLQTALINEVNLAVRDILLRKRFRWAYQRATLTTTAALTDKYIAVTNGSTTITSVTSAGLPAADWTTALTAGMYIRVGTDATSYKVATVTTGGGTPHTGTLEVAYQGTTSAASSYVALKDEYPLTTSDLEEVILASYGDAPSYGNVLSGVSHTGELGIVSLQSLLSFAHGDFHQDTSGHPRLIARIGVNSANYPVLKMWPYPDDEYVVDLWYTVKYTSLSTASGTLFTQDAPQQAEDAVALRVMARALKWNKDFTEAAERMQQYERTIGLLIGRPGTAVRQGMSVATYRRRYGTFARVESQQAFDRG